MSRLILFENRVRKVFTILEHLPYIYDCRNMLTGILEPTSGKVSIFNRPLDSMRESIGICPQHNALYK